MQKTTLFRFATFTGERTGCRRGRYGCLKTRGFGPQGNRLYKFAPVVLTPARAVLYSRPVAHPSYRMVSRQGFTPMMNGHSSEFANYMTKVKTYPRLDREEELELFHRWQIDHDERAKDKLVRANLRHCVVIALKYRCYGLPLADLVAEGNFGLAHALTKFDVKRGTRFATYAAYWIRAYILNCIIRSWSLVGVGTGPLRSKLFFKLRRERSRIMNLVHDDDCAAALLAQRFGMSGERIVTMLQRIDARDVSLDANIHGDGTVSLLDMLAAPECDQEESVASSQIDRHMRYIVQRAIETLDSRERYVVQERLMQNSEDELSLAELGRRMHVSRERARQLEIRAKTKLKRRILELANPTDLENLSLNSVA